VLTGSYEGNTVDARYVNFGDLFWPIAASREGLQSTDSVEKVGHGFHGRELRA
jgi:hypothetical protein